MEFRYWSEAIQPLIGRTVTDAAMVYDEGVSDIVPVLTFDNGMRMHLLSAEDGPCGGRFSIYGT